MIGFFLFIIGPRSHLPVLVEVRRPEPDIDTEGGLPECNTPRTRRVRFARERGESFSENPCFLGVS